MTYFIRVDAETDVVYELIAETVQKPSAEEPKPGEVVDQASEEATNTADLQGKPRSISLILITPCYIKVLCIYVQGIDWNHRCIILSTQCLY